MHPIRKTDLLRFLETLPDELDVERLTYHLYVMSRIAAGEEALARGDVIPHEEVEREINEWLSSSGPVLR